MTTWKVKSPVHFALFFAIQAGAYAQTVTYEGNAFPEKAGWERIVFSMIDRFLEPGWFVHFVDYANEIDAYRMPLADFCEADAFFIEWRVQTNAPRSILDTSGTPVVVVAGGSTGGFYHTTITDSRIQLFRATSIPLVFVDVEANVPHTYHLELFGDRSYIWYIDSQVVDSGVPQADYPNPDSSLTWGTRRQMFDTTTRWDYIRFGVIPEDGSGDFDSDGLVNLDDFHYVHECLSNSGPDVDAGPGCRFADFDFDTDVDLLDFAEFQLNFTGNE